MTDEQKSFFSLIWNVPYIHQQFINYLLLDFQDGVMLTDCHISRMHQKDIDYAILYQVNRDVSLYDAVENLSQGVLSNNKCGVDTDIIISDTCKRYVMVILHLMANPSELALVISERRASETTKGQSM